MTTIPYPDFPYTVRELRHLCQLVTHVTRELVIHDRRITIRHMVADSVTGGMTCGFHTHSAYEAIMLLRGRMEYTTDTAQQELRRGDALVFAPFTKHVWRSLDDRSIRLMLEFCIDPPLRVTPPATWPHWPELLWDVALLMGDLHTRMHESHLLIPTRMTAIISRLLTMAEWPDVTPLDVPKPMQFIELVGRFLSDNLDQPLTVADVAHYLGMGERSLIRHYRQLTGDTVMQRLFKLRMERAAGLLVDTNLPCAEIGAGVGIADPSYFCSRFRHLFGVTPRQYREQGQQNS